MRVIIVGGGIGGMTAAIALKRQGVDVAVYERAGALAEIGAGVSLWTRTIAQWIQKDAHLERPLPAFRRRVDET